MAYTHENTEKDHGRLALLSSASFIAMTVPQAPGMEGSTLPTWFSTILMIILGLLGVTIVIGSLIFRGFPNQREISLWLLGFLLALVMFFILLRASSAYWSTIASILVGLIIAFAASGKGNLFDFANDYR